MDLLIDYSCRCGVRHERWVRRPVPAERECPACGGPARRRFGATLLAGSAGPTPAAAGPDPCHSNPDVPGACCLSPTAARSLAARARGDNRALDRELAYQEAAIRTGELDPARSPVTAFAGSGPAQATAS